MLLNERRLSVQKDTCCLIAISLTIPSSKDVKHENPTVIWSVEKLPYSSYLLLPIPEPLSGVLVFCTNQLLYINQNVRYGLALNQIYSHLDFDPTFPLGNKQKIFFFKKKKIINCSFSYKFYLKKKKKFNLFQRHQK